MWCLLAPNRAFQGLCAVVVKLGWPIATTLCRSRSRFPFHSFLLSDALSNGGGDRFYLQEPPTGGDRFYLQEPPTGAPVRT